MLRSDTQCSLPFVFSIYLSNRCGRKSVLSSYVHNTDFLYLEIMVTPFCSIPQVYFYCCFFLHSFGLNAYNMSSAFFWVLNFLQQLTTFFFLLMKFGKNTLSNLLGFQKCSLCIESRIWHPLHVLLLARKAKGIVTICFSICYSMWSYLPPFFLLLRAVLFCCCFLLFVFKHNCKEEIGNA